MSVFTTMLSGAPPSHGLGEPAAAGICRYEGALLSLTRGGA